MKYLALAYPLVLLAALAIAIYVQVTTSTLALPISPSLTVLSIALPFIAFANIFWVPRLRRSVHDLVDPSAIQQLVPPLLQLLQGVIAVVLATVAAQGLGAGPVSDCRLDSAWQRFWHLHDAESVRRVQDAFGCCGLNSVRDRPWPFPGPDHTLADCSRIYHRDRSCVSAWRGATRRASGLEFAVAVGVGLLQLLHLFLVRRQRARNDQSNGVKRLPGGGAADVRSPLLTGEDDAVPDGDEEASGSASATRRRSSEDGPLPRIAPTGLGEGNGW